MRQDASNSGNYGERIGDDLKGFICICGWKTKSRGSFGWHKRKCTQHRLNAIETGEYVSCPLCPFARETLYQHLLSAHGLSSEVDKDEYGQDKLISKRYRERLSDGIMGNEDERKRRSLLLAKLNKTDTFRVRASKTAIETSKRPDVIKRRTKQLADWRKENPDKFKAITAKMLKARKFTQTKPEKFLQKWLEGEFPAQFRYNQIIKSSLYHMNRSKRKQVDFRSIDKFVYIEVDGPFHFLNFRNRKKDKKFWSADSIKTTIEKDLITERIIKERGKILIRISYDCWVDSTGRVKNRALKKMHSIIKSRKAGIYKLGEAYGDDNIL